MRELSGEMRGRHDVGAEMGELVLVGAVVVHHPDVFVGSGFFDVVDLGLGDAGRSAAEAQDDLVGEAVGDLAGGVVVGLLRCIAWRGPADTARFWCRRDSRRRRGFRSRRRSEPKATNDAPTGALA